VSELTNSDDSGQCDVFVQGTTYFMKLDATVNLYHHFCDFLNLYMTQHLAAAFFLGHREAFSLDSNILIWDNSLYRSNFGGAFQAFTKRPLLNLNSWGASRVCFERAVFSLPPRMLFGLYYNTPIAAGCSNSSLFRAFSEHLTHRLELDPIKETKAGHKLRVLLLSRGTRHRRILNEHELVEALKKTGR
jgi:protein O-GlcNAc transferase